MNMGKRINMKNEILYNGRIVYRLAMNYKRCIVEEIRIAKKQNIWHVI